MKFSATFIASALLALASAAPVEIEERQASPDPSKVWISGIRTGGTGCPAGTVAHQISSDRSTFTLIFDEYVASLGPGVPVTDSRKNCQLNVHLQYPGGWQYSVFSATYRGYAGLARGQEGVQKSTYYFSGQTNQASTQTIFRGPMSQDYTYTDKVDQVSTVWSPCGREGMLNINSQVRITGDNRQNGMLTTDSIDGKFTQIVGVTWRRC